jgi:hypothetical protein
MMTFFKSFQSGEQQAIPMYNRISLTRSFVETGDERCPLAGIWSRLPETDSAVDDEPGLTWPVRGVLLFGALPERASGFRVIPHS